MSKKGMHGGARLGAGRPQSDNPRTLHGLKFTDQEWEIIKNLAAEQKMNAREYISWLVSEGHNQPRTELETTKKRRRKMENKNKFLKTEDWMELSERGYWIIDELIFDPHYTSSGCIVKDRGSYYFIRYRGFEICTVEQLPAYRDSKEYERPTYNHEYITRGVEPRNGFKPIKVKRAITQEEFEELKKQLGLTEDDISDETLEVLGDLYGGKSRTEYTVRQIRTKEPFYNISLSRELSEKGIQATAPCPGRVNIRVK